LAAILIAIRPHAAQWHFSWETYTLSQSKVLNAADPAGIIANGGYPFTAVNGFKFNAPNFAQCSSPYVVTCTVRMFTSLMYVNYRISGLDNLSFRGEFYNDMEGQRTGTKTRYLEFGLGWQHWLSPQVELRPEVSYYRSLDANAFNGNFNAVTPYGNPHLPHKGLFLGRLDGSDLAFDQPCVPPKASRRPSRPARRHHRGAGRRHRMIIVFIYLHAMTRLDFICANE
jgi:hypothetical protein